MRLRPMQRAARPELHPARREVLVFLVALDRDQVEVDLVAQVALGPAPVDRGQADQGRPGHRASMALGPKKACARVRARMPLARPWDRGRDHRREKAKLDPKVIVRRDSIVDRGLIVGRVLIVGRDLKALRVETVGRGLIVDRGLKALRVETVGRGLIVDRDLIVGRGLIVELGLIVGRVLIVGRDRMQPAGRRKPGLPMQVQPLRPRSPRLRNKHRNRQRRLQRQSPHRRPRSRTS